MKTDKETSPKTESIQDAIRKAINTNDKDAALELIDYWQSKIPQDSDEWLIFYYTKLQVLTKCYDETEDYNAKMAFLHDAIEIGNKFFALNEEKGFPMDAEVQKMWFVLVDLSAEFVANYSQEEYDEEDSECEECEDEFEDEDYSTNIFTEAIHAGIGKINMPNLKPKPPRKYDDSLKSKLLKAIDLHMNEYGGLEHEGWNLIKNICKTLDFDFDDFSSSIYDY